jgi:hypothetical protein
MSKNAYLPCKGLRVEIARYIVITHVNFQQTEVMHYVIRLSFNLIKIQLFIDGVFWY